MSSDQFRSRIDTLVQRVHGVAPAPGFSEVMFPGEPEQRIAEERKRGIPYTDAETAMFRSMAEKYGVEPLSLIPK
jgi:LDH2 family malate/lactate/ureidoglycolate dehydrogenase